jgi:hypothetical protein
MRADSFRPFDRWAEQAQPRKIAISPSAPSEERQAITV